MSVAAARSGADDAALRRCLEAGLTGDRGAVAGIRGVHWLRFDLATSYDAHIAVVRLTTGEELEVFVKDFGYSVRMKDGARARREREVRVYREILADADLGTPLCYGAVLDEAGGRLWLLLERVHGEPVGYCPLQTWAPAAAALGRVHGHFASRLQHLTECAFLIRHTADFFRSRAERGVENVATIASQHLGRAARLATRYAPTADRLAELPWTLVHGGCRPSNILINITPPARRACIVDWEEAGIGSPYFDLAYLLDGVPQPLLDELLEAHREAAGSYGLALPPPDEARYLIECFRLHMVMNYLSRAVLRGYDEAAIAKLLDLGERIGEQVLQSAD